MTGSVPEGEPLTRDILRLDRITTGDRIRARLGRRAKSMLRAWKVVTVEGYDHASGLHNVRHSDKTLTTIDLFEPSAEWSLMGVSTPFTA